MEELRSTIVFVQFAEVAGTIGLVLAAVLGWQVWIDRRSYQAYLRGYHRKETLVEKLKRSKL